MTQILTIIVEHDLEKNSFESIIKEVILLMKQRGCEKVEIGPFTVDNE